MNVITRDEALEQGLKRYYTGVPCKHGHVCERNARDYMCLECSKLQTKKHREKNPQKTRDSQKKYREQNRLRVLANKKRYYEQNKKNLIQKRRQYALDNPEKEKAWHRKAITDLTDGYIRSKICQRSCLSSSDIPPLLVEAKRAHIKLTRQLKEYEKNGHTST